MCTDPGVGQEQGGPSPTKGVPDEAYVAVDLAADAPISAAPPQSSSRISFPSLIRFMVLTAHILPHMVQESSWRGLEEAR